MNEHDSLSAVDPYGAIAVWYFDANRDPDKFLKIFEGVAPRIRGMVWTLEGYVPESELDCSEKLASSDSDSL